MYKAYEHDAFILYIKGEDIHTSSTTWYLVVRLVSAIILAIVCMWDEGCKPATVAHATVILDQKERIFTVCAPCTGIYGFVIYVAIRHASLSTMAFTIFLNLD